MRETRTPWLHYRASIPKMEVIQSGVLKLIRTLRRQLQPDDAYLSCECPSLTEVHGEEQDTDVCEQQITTYGVGDTSAPRDESNKIQ